MAGNAHPPRGTVPEDMGDHRPIDRARAERLLNGTDPGTDAVGRLLAAARAPVQPHELHREAAALGAFEAETHAAPRRSAPHRQIWPRLVGVKAVAVALAVAVAGVALAAGTGVLPNPLVNTDTPPAPTSAGPTGTPGAPGTSPADRRSPSTNSGSGTPTVAPSSSAADHASLVGLCRAYQARGQRDPGAALGSAAFAALVAAAGGADRVEAFCTDLLAAEDQHGQGGNTGPGNGATPGRSAARGNGAAQRNSATQSDRAT